MQKWILPLAAPIFLSACSMRPAEIETLRAVERRLEERQGTIGAYRLDMKAAGSKLVLSGRVGSVEGRRAIEDVVSTTPGVLTVQNDMVVDPSLRAGSRTNSDSVSIIEDVMNRFREIKGDKPVKAKIEVSEGVVLLTGAVATEAERQKFVSAARTARGVSSVVDNLRVPAPLTNEELSRNVRSALSDENLLSSGPLSLNVDRGTVRLEGDRRTFREVDKLLSVVLMVDGVEDIDSRMTVNGAPYDNTIAVK